MTRARKAANGVMTPPPLDRWIDAVLLLCVSLVQGVAATLGMWLGRKARECHTQLAVPALPQAKPDIQLPKDTTTPAVILGPDPRILLGISPGLSNSPLDTKQDSRLKAENDAHVAAWTEAQGNTKSLTPLIPANAGIQGGPQVLFRLTAPSLPLAARPFLDSDVRRNERNNARQLA